MDTRSVMLNLGLALACTAFGGDRITSLECWGKRARHDFTEASVRFAKASGFTGVLVNGGSGFGADQIPLELAHLSPVIPRLAPYTAKSNERELSRRCGLLRQAGLDAWWCQWGVVGPDLSDLGGPCGPSNRLFDRRSKLEMKAEFLRHPELFGARNPRSLSWRGSRPLCLGHPTVRAFYRDQVRRVVSAYGIRGMVFFPGDSDAECCDAACERCSKLHSDSYGLMIELANDLLTSAREVKGDFRLYMVVWNSGHERIGRYLGELVPAAGLAMSFTDGYVETRPAGTHAYNQPWVNCAEAGKSFLFLAEACRKSNRPVMALGEIAQSEVWDPLHDMPNPTSTLGLLKKVRAVDASAAVMDFWGMRRPFESQANLEAMRAWVASPEASDDELLATAAARHYGIVPTDTNLVRAAREAWRTFEETDRGSSLVSWPQRFSFGIGRDRARGQLYRALTPAFLRSLPSSWTYRMTAGISSLDRFVEAACNDRERYGRAADVFGLLSRRLAPVSREGGARAHNKALQIRLAGELFGSEARALAAAQAYARKDAAALRRLIEDEIAARERELALSAELGPESGVDPFLVEEDLQNMRLYLSTDTFPEAPDEIFSFTESPYSV